MLTPVLNQILHISQTVIYFTWLLVQIKLTTCQSLMHGCFHLKFTKLASLRGERVEGVKPYKCCISNGSSLSCAVSWYITQSQTQKMKPCNVTTDDMVTWWLHVMELFSALFSLCEKNPSTDGFRHKRPVMQSFGVCFVVRCNKLLDSPVASYVRSPMLIWCHDNHIFDMILIKPIETWIINKTNDALTHWGQLHICISKLTSIVSDNGLLP